MFKEWWVAGSEQSAVRSLLPYLSFLLLWTNSRLRGAPNVTVQMELSCDNRDSSSACRLSLALLLEKQLTRQESISPVVAVCLFTSSMSLQMFGYVLIGTGLLMTAA